MVDSIKYEKKLSYGPPTVYKCKINDNMGISQCNHNCDIEKENSITYSDCKIKCTNSQSCVAFLPEHGESSLDPGFCYIYNKLELNSTDYVSQGNYILYKKKFN